MVRMVRMVRSLADRTFQLCLRRLQEREFCYLPTRPEADRVGLRGGGSAVARRSLGDDFVFTSAPIALGRGQRRHDQTNIFLYYGVT